MKLNRLFVALLLLAVMASCKKDEFYNDGVTVTAKNLYNVAYGPDGKQTMDIYLPAGRRSDSTKVMILIHGGGWTTGDKIDLNSYVDSFKKRLPEYAFFNINYRLSAGGTTNVFPAQEDDIRLALNYVYYKASDYQVSQKIVLAGASAGGHLAMLQGYKDSFTVKPKAIVSFFGPSDLVDMYINPVGGSNALRLLLAAAVGKTPTQDMPLYLNSSPVNFIRSTSAPTILLHGSLDPLVDTMQSIKVKDLLTLAGVTNQYVNYPTGGHGDWSNATYTDAFNKVQAFLRANVR